MMGLLQKRRTRRGAASPSQEDERAEAAGGRLRRLERILGHDPDAGGHGEDVPPGESQRQAPPPRRSSAAFSTAPTRTGGAGTTSPSRRTRRARSPAATTRSTSSSSASTCRSARRSRSSTSGRPTAAASARDEARPALHHRGRRDAQVATLICYEDIIPAFTNALVNATDPELLVNITKRRLVRSHD